MASLFELVNQLGILSVGRRPRWFLQENTAGPPASLTSGTSITNAVKALMHVALREEAHRKTTRITATDGGGGTYTVTIDSTAVAVSTGGAGVTDILEDLRDGINANGTVSLIVIASVEDDELVLRGQGSADYTVAVTTDLAGEELTIEREDASTCDVRVWLLPDGTGDTPDVWVQANDAFFEAIDYRGLTERVSTAGFRRVYVQVEEADGEVSVAVGPGVME